MTGWSFHRRNENAVCILITAFVLSVSGINYTVAQPTASFSASPTVGCAPLTVVFSNNSIGANSYFWDFGNGNTSTLQNPTTVYLTPGFFTVSLVAINSLTGQRDTMTAGNYIHTVIPPNANFTALPLAGCVNDDIIYFSNTSTGAVSYTWDFGDGASSTLQNPSHIYSNPGSYNIKLIATNGFGCSTIQIKNNYITIHPKPDASFTSSNTSTCDSSDVFSFNSTGSGIAAWMWDFGDGTSSNLQNPTHIYNSTGSFTVTLIAINNFGCSDTVSSSNFINIGNTLVPSFTVNNTLGCGSLNAAFNCTVPNANSWAWNFGDGGTSTLKNPTHLYSTTGSYTITLTVTTNSGCNGSVTLVNYIQVDPMPGPNFTVAQVNPCDPYTFQFTNTTTNGVTYLWEFGDGSTSTAANPVHTYPSETIYHVTLHAYSANGCEMVLTLNGAVDINDYNPGFTGTPKIGCAPLPVNFTTNNYPGAVSWFWDFGDGSTSTLHYPSHTYTVNGSYTVSLKITTNAGCVDSLIKVNYIQVVPGQVSYTVPDTIIGCTPFSASFTDPTLGSNIWHWDFGDGDTSNLQNPSHLYTIPGIYIVTLQTNMAGGCNQFFNPYAIIQVIPFVPEPILILSMSPCSPYQIQFTDSTIGVTQWLWDFGDGSTDTVMSPTHIYAQPGTYTISVSMIIPNGCPSTQTLTVTVGHPNPIQVNNNSFCTDDTMHFTINNPLAFTSYLWNFGDGSPTSTAQNVNHIYGAAGDYTAMLIATDTSGCVDTFYTDLHIRALSVGFLTNDPTTGCDGLSIHFINTSVNAISYLWNFGDSTTATSPNPSHYYGNPGTFTVTLTATNGGCVKTYSQPNLVTLNEANADFSFIASGTCFPITVSYTDLSVNAVTWFWNFGDGNTGIVQNPTHVFNNQPTGSVQLIIIDNNGCTDSKTRSNISGFPLNVDLSDTIGCKPLSVSFSDSTNGATSWFWNFGDGTTSTQQNPSHTFSDTGSYVVQITVTLASGCTSTYTLPNAIQVTAPIADFNSPTMAVCAPSLVQFNNLSQNAVSYLWDFGDGITSTATNPSHIYNIPGDYTITLIATDSLGCSTTEIKIDYIHVPGTYAYFTLTSQLNCLNNFVVFQDSSINATSWSWNFGDGYTSTLENPQHLYQDTGSYIVSLITMDSLGCTSYYTYPDPIVVYPAPVAQGSTASLGGCQPYTASFTNSSAGAINYVWHFGDGDSSTTDNPVHVYNTWGIFNVTVVAINQYGCSDTFNVATVNVDQTPDALFSPNSNVGCTPFTAQFNNTSTSLSTPSFAWDFGNGQTSTLQNPSVIYSNPGVYTVKLVVQNANGCVDSVFTLITVNLTPTAMASTIDTAGCGPYTAAFFNQSINANSYQWFFGDGNTSSQPDPVHTYTNSGIYTPYLIANSASGCSDTFYLSTTINVKLTPIADFTTDSTGGCSGSTFTFNNTSSNLSNPTYNWSIGTISSTQQDPNVTLITPGFYTVSLIVINDNGCSDSISKSSYIEVYDTSPPPVTPLLSVSVKTNTSVEIKWLPSAALDLEEYRLFRWNPSTTVFDLIYSELHPNNSNPNVTGYYLDNGLNTLQNVYTYKIQTIDRCGYKLSLNNSVAHTTINVTAQAQGQNINVDWTPYIGCPVLNYEIHRVEVSNGLSQLVAIVPSNILTYLDTTLNCPFEYSYRITATDLCGNPYISLSDTSIAVPITNVMTQQVEVVRSTVILNKSVLTEWTEPVIARDRVLKYNILRSIDNVNFSLIASLPASVFSYIDDNVDVNEHNYFYKVDVVNDCNLSGILSNNSSSILLKSDWINEKTKLWWTEYDEWDNGVDYYTIEKKDQNGNWIQVKIISGSSTETVLDE